MGVLQQIHSHLPIRLCQVFIEMYPQLWFQEGAPCLHTVLREAMAT